MNKKWWKRDTILEIKENKASWFSLLYIFTKTFQRKKAKLILKDHKMFIYPKFFQLYK